MARPDSKRTPLSKHRTITIKQARERKQRNGYNATLTNTHNTRSN